MDIRPGSGFQYVWQPNRGMLPGKTRARNGGSNPMLRARPNSFFSWKFTIFDEADQNIAGIDIGWVRKAGPHLCPERKRPSDREHKTGECLDPQSTHRSAGRHAAAGQGIHCMACIGPVEERRGILVMRPRAPLARGSKSSRWVSLFHTIVKPGDGEHERRKG